MIRVQEAPFDPAAELAAFRSGHGSDGATVLFLGTVRELSGDKTIAAMTLEHYPGMTERELEAIRRQAHERFEISASLIVHRYGRMTPGEDIVLVIAQSAHREAAFEAARFMMDFLKTRAPFWKLEEGKSGKAWVEARDSDDAAARRWDDAEGR
jgi:molybdopterin synthase catalytic subunit